VASLAEISAALELVINKVEDTMAHLIEAKQSSESATGGVLDVNVDSASATLSEVTAIFIQNNQDIDNMLGMYQGIIDRINTFKGTMGG
jgi:hypothetical protein